MAKQKYITKNYVDKSGNDYTRTTKLHNPRHKKYKQKYSTKAKQPTKRSIKLSQLNRQLTHVNTRLHTTNPQIP